MNKYILYCAQEANFQTRSMLIPYDLIMKCPERVKHLQILRDNALRNVPFNYKDKEYVVDQLLIQNITWNENCGSYDETPYKQIVSELTCYGDEMYFNSYDEEWSNNIICYVASEGFNHVTNYCNFRNKSEYKGSPIEIVEGFLILQSHDGILNMPSVETVEEMFAKYYPEMLDEYKKSKQ